MSLNDTVGSILEDVEGSLACGVVDLNTGLMLSSAHNVPYFSQTYIDAVAASAVEMFRGKNISTVEKLLSDQRGQKTEKTVKEIQMSTDGTYHFMSVVPGKEDALVVLVTSRKTNLGMGWSALRGALVDIAPHC